MTKLQRRSNAKQITEAEEETLRENWWNEVVANPTIFEPEIISNRMFWFQDKGFKKYAEDNKEYFKKREKILIDCDKSSGCPLVDELHQELRTQFQQKYNKDVKHG